MNSNATLRSFCPATGEEVWVGSADDATSVRLTSERARAAQLEWRASKLEDRVHVARAYAAILNERSETLAETISRETGKPLWESRQEVGSMVGKVELSIAAQSERAGERHGRTTFGETVLRHRPHGVMAVLGPYNFPGHLPNGHIVPALLAGNAVVFKPSELTPGVGHALVSAWRDAGLPSDVLGLVQGGRDVGEALVDSNIDGLLFTGSAATGAHLRRRFAERPDVILALELGGNNPLIVWDGAVDEAAAIVVQSAFVTTGQRCSCARRLVLPTGSFGDAVVDAVLAMSDRLRIGGWSNRPEPYMGPLVSSKAADFARTQVSRLVGLGSRVIRSLDDVGGRDGAFVGPALLDVTGISSPDEEIFAPVLQIVRVDDPVAAIEEANRTRFGLSAALVSQDDDLWTRALLDVRAGILNRNRPTTGAAGSMPFGGLGDSGNHRPSAYYAADYCAHPLASFEASDPEGNLKGLEALLAS